MNLPQLTDIQKRVTYIVVASGIALASIFFTLTQGNQSHAASQVDPQVNIVATPTVPSMIVVDVAGKVHSPGVYTLPSGSRAIDAIKMAGNALTGVSLTDINLAHVLFDGEQIVVGAPQVIVQSTGRSGVTKNSSITVSVNSASVQQLQVLKGIGPVTAKRIVDYRKSHGSFKSLEDFRKVSKLGTTKFAEIKKQLRL